MSYTAVTVEIATTKYQSDKELVFISNGKPSIIMWNKRWFFDQ